MRDAVPALRLRRATTDGRRVGIGNGSGFASLLTEFKGISFSVVRQTLSALRSHRHRPKTIHQLVPSPDLGPFN